MMMFAGFGVFCAIEKIFIDKIDGKWWTTLFENQDRKIRELQRETRALDRWCDDLAEHRQAMAGYFKIHSVKSSDQELYYAANEEGTKINSNEMKINHE